MVVHLAIGGVFLVRHWQQPQADIQKPRKPRPQTITIGGIDRPITDIKPRKLRSDNKSDAASKPVIDVGRTPGIPKDANPMVASVAEALETGKYPERLSVMIAPKPFNQAAFEADPKAYLNIVEPGRVWQPAQPGPDVTRLKRISDHYVEVQQGETITLKVKALPGAPVTFTSFDLGAFQNRLTSITVQANEDGDAAARFTGTPGTFNDVNILAASPMTSGQSDFRINVIPPLR